MGRHKVKATEERIIKVESLLFGALHSAKACSIALADATRLVHEDSGFKTRRHRIRAMKAFRVLERARCQISVLWQIVLEDLEDAAPGSNSRSVADGDADEFGDDDVRVEVVACYDADGQESTDSCQAGRER